ncbi:alpha/beta hydrolase [Xanthovirga aplysinae]|uniref:alpha/beta hydrolase n=1 Tax=Xanthovirga aplysinae TaxID=2529853 RepID=UPI0012BBA506|nr:alpha/beta hydrolase-fold protein [Xanthovirga aplysinae]MTI29802.1 alpha/beta hydrolase [Xanthovirga aplysinae]
MKHMKLFPLFTISFPIFLLLTSCTTKKKIKESKPLHETFTQYSESVKDTFYIDVQLPKEYYKNPNKNYTTVYLLDGNFFFPITAPLQHQYESTGLLKPIILVSIGYKSFKTMDSLRVRDYLYPKSIPSDEIEAIGGGQKFKNFITNELIPQIDSEFRTKKDDRVLAGHSFGGYFVLYALWNQLDTEKSDFKSFISASPTLWYNNFYLNQLPEKLKEKNKDLNLFLTVGGKENATWAVQPVIDFSKQIKILEIKNLQFKNRVYNHLDHMDLGLLSFTKGLQELTQEQN